MKKIGCYEKTRNSELIVDSLNIKFGDKSGPTYIFKNIDCEDIEEKRDGERSRKYIIVDGSSKFQ